MTTTPTAAEFKDRYPAFSAVGDAIVDDVMAEASSRVGASWIEADKRPAMMAYAAHALTLEGWGSPSVSVGEASMQVAGEVDQIRVGDVHASFGGKTRAEVSMTARDDLLAETAYGRRFIEIRKRNSIGVMII